MSSPLRHLVAEGRHGDYQAREALFTTFNADLGFFERTALGAVQATGARVTVLGDATVWDPDTRAARNAGVRYLTAVAAHPAGAAFHPKVNVVVGPQRVLVTIGSGNLSPGGWHLNSELWTLITGTQQGCPDVVGTLVPWLRSLPDVVVMTGQARDAVHRTADELASFTASVPTIATGFHLVETSSGPIIDQLPTAPVRELALYAPFHDQRAQALRALVRRYRPEVVRLAVQDGARTAIDVTATLAVLAELREELGVRLVVQRDASTRYRHGKLVQARAADGTAWALTGSPNLSTRALLTGAAAGGNIEVGLLSPVTETLFPPGEHADLARVSTRAVGSPASGASSGMPILLGATCGPEGLRVELARPPVGNVRVEGGWGVEFETWSPVGLVPPGHRTAVLDVDGAVPARVRLGWPGPDGAWQAGPAHFVADVGRVMVRAADLAVNARGLVRDPAQLTRPPEAEAWLARLAELAAQAAAVAMPTAAGPRPPRAEDDGEGQAERHWAVPDEEDRWRRMHDTATSDLGSALLAFTLGGPRAVRALRSRHADLVLEVPSDALVAEKEVGLDDDDIEDLEDVDAPDGGGGDEGQEAGSPAQDAPGVLSARDRQRVRRALDHALHELAPRLEIHGRMMVAAWVLQGLRDQVWSHPHGIDGWAEPLAESMTVLEHRNSDGASDIPPRWLPNVAALAAVGCYLLHDAQAEDEDSTLRTHFVRAAGGVSHLLEHASVGSIADYAEGLRNGRGFAIDPDDVLTTALSVLDDDPLAGLLDHLGTTHPGWEVHAHGTREIHVLDEHSSNVMLLAAEVLALVPAESDPFAVRATGSADRYCVLVREGNDLLCVDGNRTDHRWRHFTTTHLVTPTVIARDRETAARMRVHHGGPWTHPYPGAASILARVEQSTQSVVTGACPLVERPLGVAPGS